MLPIARWATLAFTFLPTLALANGFQNSYEIPLPPLASSEQDCSSFLSRWNAVIARIDQDHRACLDSQEHGTRGNGSCSRLACQSLHDIMDTLHKARAGADAQAASCRDRVAEQQQQIAEERRQREAILQQERRRQEDSIQASIQKANDQTRLTQAWEQQKVQEIASSRERQEAAARLAAQIRNRTADNIRNDPVLSREALNNIASAQHQAEETQLLAENKPLLETLRTNLQGFRVPMPDPDVTLLENGIRLESNDERIAETSIGLFERGVQLGAVYNAWRAFTSTTSIEEKENASLDLVGAIGSVALVNPVSGYLFSKGLTAFQHASNQAFSILDDVLDGKVERVDDIDKIPLGIAVDMIPGGKFIQWIDTKVRGFEAWRANQ